MEDKRCWKSTPLLIILSGTIVNGSQKPLNLNVHHILLPTLLKTTCNTYFINVKDRWVEFIWSAKLKGRNGDCLPQIKIEVQKALSKKKTHTDWIYSIVLVKCFQKTGRVNENARDVFILLEINAISVLSRFAISYNKRDEHHKFITAFSLSLFHYFVTLFCYIYYI